MRKGIYTYCMHTYCYVCRWGGTREGRMKRHLCAFEQCICIHVCRSLHARKCKCIDVYTHCIWVCVYTCECGTHEGRMFEKSLCMYTCIHVYMYICIYVYMYTRTYVYTYICICVCVSVLDFSVHSYMHTFNVPMHAHMYTCIYPSFFDESLCLFVYMFVCMYSCTYVYMHACVHLYFDVCIYGCLHVCIYAYVRMCVYVRMCACVCVCECLCVCMCANVRMCMCSSVCARAYVHTWLRTRTQARIRARTLRQTQT